MTAEASRGGEGTEARRCGFAAIIGAPNAGKSTLVNALVGSKVAIVTHKAQTTRAPIRGIVISGASQIVLVDTPGIFKPKRRLDRAMVDAAWSRAGDADVVVVLVDALRGLTDDVRPILETLETMRGRRLLVLNKIDRVRKDRLLALTAEITSKLAFEATFMISALTGDGIADLTRHLAGLMPLGEWHYPEDEISDAPMRSLAAEITREKLLLRLHDELPYAATVETALWKELKGGAVRIEQTIYVERDSQKQIVLGKGGRMIKEISMAARKEIAELIEVDVHLFLFVKVRERWGDDPERYREMGLELPKDGG